jgi:hypothetical protein
MNLDRLKTTPEQDECIARCFASLDEEEVAACEEEACEIAGAILNAPKAASDLVRTLVQVIIRNAKERGGLL